MLSLSKQCVSDGVQLIGAGVDTMTFLIIQPDSVYRSL